jgi:hypothetical protein
VAAAGDNAVALDTRTLAAGDCGPTVKKSHPVKHGIAFFRSLMIWFSNMFEE